MRGMFVVVRGAEKTGDWIGWWRCNSNPSEMWRPAGERQPARRQPCRVSPQNKFRRWCWRALAHKLEAAAAECEWQCGPISHQQKRGRSMISLAGPAIYRLPLNHRSDDDDDSGGEPAWFARPGGRVIV
jgi:hypothetical protein